MALSKDCKDCMEISFQWESLGTRGACVTTDIQYSAVPISPVASFAGYIGCEGGIHVCRIPITLLSDQLVQILLVIICKVTLLSALLIVPAHATKDFRTGQWSGMQLGRATILLSEMAFW